MIWLKSLFARKPLSPIQFDTTYVEPSYLVKGKWVVCDNIVGVVTDLSSSGVVGIDSCHQVTGDYLGHVVVSAHGVMLAKFVQIPESRRPTTKEYASQLGYN